MATCRRAPPDGFRPALNREGEVDMWVINSCGSPRSLRVDLSGWVFLGSGGENHVQKVAFAGFGRAANC